MKHFFVLFSVLLIFGSCASFRFASSENSSWSFPGGEKEKIKGTVRIVSVSVEKSAQRDFIEKEIKDLLPLLFLEEGYLAVSDPAAADYSVEAIVREREYIDGWRTKRSLSAELRFRTETCAGEPLPLSAGQALLEGKRSLSSSKTLNAILRKAVKNSIRGLPVKDAKTDRGREEN